MDENRVSRNFIPQMKTLVACSWLNVYELMLLVSVSSIGLKPESEVITYWHSVFVVWQYNGYSPNCYIKHYYGTPLHASHYYVGRFVKCRYSVLGAGKLCMYCTSNLCIKISFYYTALWGYWRQRADKRLGNPPSPKVHPQGQRREDPLAVHSCV